MAIASDAYSHAINAITIHFKEARKGFLVAIVFVERLKIPKKDIS